MNSKDSLDEFHRAKNVSYSEVFLFHCYIFLCVLLTPHKEQCTCHLTDWTSREVCCRRWRTWASWTATLSPPLLSGGGYVSLTTLFKTFYKIFYHPNVELGIGPFGAPPLISLTALSVQAKTELLWEVPDWVLCRSVSRNCF